jgi:hypothetical protein
MGQLRHLVKNSADFDQVLKKRIDDAKTRRDFLAHRYWREQAFTMQTKEGREKMIAELVADAETFEKLAADIQVAVKPVRAKLGITDEVLDAHVEKQMAYVRAACPSSERRLVRVSTSPLRSLAVRWQGAHNSAKLPV